MKRKGKKIIECVVDIGDSSPQEMKKNVLSNINSLGIVYVYGLVRDLLINITLSTLNRTTGVTVEVRIWNFWKIN